MSQSGSTLNAFLSQYGTLLNLIQHPVIIFKKNYMSDIVLAFFLFLTELLIFIIFSTSVSGTKEHCFDTIHFMRKPAFCICENKAADQQ